MSDKGSVQGPWRVASSPAPTSSLSRELGLLSGGASGLSLLKDAGRNSSCDC